MTKKEYDLKISRLLRKLENKERKHNGRVRKLELKFNEYSRDIQNQIDSLTEDYVLTTKDLKIGDTIYYFYTSNNSTLDEFEICSGKILSLGVINDERLIHVNLNDTSINVLASNIRYSKSIDEISNIREEEINKKSAMLIEKMKESRRKLTDHLKKYNINHGCN